MADSPHSKAKLKKDMYWFAHGGEPLPDKSHQQRSDGDEELGSPEQHNSPSWKPLQERKALPEEARNQLVGNECAAAVLADNVDNSSLLSRTERDDRVAVAPDSYGIDARISANHMRAAKNTEDQKSKKMSEAEQDNSDVRAKRKVEREAALEARRNAQRSSVSFAFGSSLPRNLDLDVTTVYQGTDLDRNKRRSAQVSSQKSGPVVNVVSKTKTEGWAHMHTSLFTTSESTQSDKIHSWTPVNPLPNCLVGSGAFVADDKMSQSMISPMSACRGRRKTDLTPTIPYERTAPPRTPVTSASSGKRSVSMTRLDQLARPRRTYVEAQRDHAKANSTSSTSSGQKDIQNSPSRPRSSASEHSAGSNRPSTTPPVNMRARNTARKPRPVSIAGTMPDRKPTVEFKKDLGVHRTPEKKNDTPSTKRAATANKAKSPAPKLINADKPGQRTPIKHLTPKSSPVKKMPMKSKKPVAAALSTSAETVNPPVEETLKVTASPPESPSADEEENGSSMPDQSGGKRIISEEEAKAALAEKRRLAREQAEKEAELERQRQEELRREEEERIRKEEEEQRKMEEEQLHLLEEHRRQEEEKLRKAIEEQERKEQEEKLRREEEARLKFEQEKKAKEEAERQRIELEDKLRKEEEERAERKKRLEKIMSRTRGKGASSASSHGGDQSDSADSQAGEAAEALSGNSSLNSVQSTDPSSGSASLEIHPESTQGSENESLNSLEMMALSDNSSLDSNLLMLPSEGAPSLDSDQASTLSDQKMASDVKSLGFDHAASKDVSVEPNTLFSTSGDNQSSCSSENETIKTDTTLVLTEERKSSDHPSVASGIEDNLDSVSDKLLDFGIDSVQTLISQTEDADFSIGDQLVADVIFGADVISRDVLKEPDVVSSENFAAGSKQVDEIKSQPNTFTISSQETQAADYQEILENNDFSANPFTSPFEMPTADIRHGTGSEIQGNDKNMISQNQEDKSPSEKEMNVDSSEVSISAPTVTPENIYFNEEHPSQNYDEVKISVEITSNLSEENLSSSPQPFEKNVDIPTQDHVSPTHEIVDKSCEQQKNADASQSLDFPEEISDGSTMQQEGCTDATQALDLSDKIFEGSSEKYVESTEAVELFGSSSGKVFDGSSEQYVESTSPSQLLGSSGKIFDGNSEQYVESADVSHPLDSSSKLFDGNSEHFVEMPQSTNLVVNPFIESKFILSDDNSVLPGAGASDLVKMDYSSGVITSIEDLEPSAIHSVQTRVNLGDEHFVNASITDSEDSSLDSNLSQVMSVNTIYNTTSQESGVIKSAPVDITSELSGKTTKLDTDSSCKPYQKIPQYNNSDYAPATNGYQSHMMDSFSYGNGIDGDCKTSGIADDQKPVSSLIDNEVNSNVISSINNHHVENILNTGDINFNKVPSNPFLATDDTSEISGNQYLHQEEIMRTVQTEFHA